MWQHHAIVLSVLAALIVPGYLLDHLLLRSRGDIFLIDLSGLLISSYAVWFAVHVAISSLSLYLVDTQRLYALHGFPAVASAGLAALGYVVVGQVESARYEARIRLELLAREQARVTMIADGSGERMTFEVPHRTQGDGVTIEMPGDEPLRLLRDGRDLVSSEYPLEALRPRQGPLPVGDGCFAALSGGTRSGHNPGPDPGGPARTRRGSGSDARGASARARQVARARHAVDAVDATVEVDRCDRREVNISNPKKRGSAMPVENSRRDFLRRSALLFAAAGLGCGRAWAQAPRYVTAETAFGAIRGVDVDGIKTFKGVPYGGSTAGRNRFLPPTDPGAWTRIRDALDWGPSAPQREPGVQVPGSPLSVAAAGLPAESEDCLVLNIWTPAVGDGGRRPVMVWCHGGGFSSGSGSSPVTDGTNLARRGDVVAVSINHRLNVLGFTYLEALGGADFAGSGDAGMLDIVKALEWVRGNIAELGGDPGNVTVFGQSGGGRKVATLLTMPSAKGLFHRAIIQSGATLQLVEPEQATRVAETLIAKLGVSRSQPRRLQELPLEQIMSAYFAVVREMNVDQMTMGFSPTVDGRFVPRHPFHPDASPVSAEVPLMIGATRTELTTSSDDAAFSLSDEGLRARIDALLGDKASYTIGVYRDANPQATPSDLYFLIASDHRYGAPVMKIAERRAALGGGPVYLYYFRWESPYDGGRLRSPHTIEIPFAFDNLDKSRLTAGSPTAPALADKVSDAWLAFARTGDPSTPKLPAWPPYDAGKRATMVFDDVSAVAEDPIGAARAVMFDALYPS